MSALEKNSKPSFPLNEIMHKLSNAMKCDGCSSEDIGRHQQLVYDDLTRYGESNRIIRIKNERHDDKCKEYEDLFHFIVRIVNKPRDYIFITEDKSYHKNGTHYHYNNDRRNVPYFELVCIDLDSFIDYVKSQLQDEDGVNDIDYIRTAKVEDLLNKYEIKPFNNKRHETKHLAYRPVEFYRGELDLDSVINGLCISVNSNICNNFLQNIKVLLEDMEIKGYYIFIKFSDEDDSNKGWLHRIFKTLTFELKMNNDDMAKKKW